MAAASSGSSYALAATQGVLKLCTFNVGCKEDGMYQKKWPAFTADLLQSFTRIQEHANMVCLQEVAKKVWDATQKFGIMWNPEVWKINLDDSITVEIEAQQ